MPTTYYLRSGSWNWNDPDAWSLTSGGTNDAGSIPDNAVQVVLDSNSGDVTIDIANAFCLSLDCNFPSIDFGPYVGTLSQNSGPYLYIGDNGGEQFPDNAIALRFSPGMTYSTDGTAVILFQSNTVNSTPLTIDTSGLNVRSFEFNSGSQSFYVMSNSISFSDSGHFTMSPLANFDTSFFSIIMNNPTSFAGGGKTYASLNLLGVTGSLPITGSNTFGGGFYNPAFYDSNSAGAHSLVFDAGGTTTFLANDFEVSGTAGQLITLNSTSTAVFYFVGISSPVISVDYLNIQHCVATPGLTWYAGTHSTNNQGDADAGSGWIFTAPITTLIKTINGLLYASIKTVNGLAIASVKAINGLA